MENDESDHCDAENTIVGWELGHHTV